MQIKLAAGLAAAAALFPPSPASAEEWCPGEPWRLEWGVNVDFETCHGTPSLNNHGLDGGNGAMFGDDLHDRESNHVDQAGVSTGNARTHGGNQEGGGASANTNGTTTGSVGGNQAGSAGGSPRT
ncbi:hypothetical protein [Segniliparus rugosus]|uniref:Pilin n=1 Tax=Segniliparus rugosus (strain ATCC BAA-974 / DSM 45345 / CCUG 50838 / CIP 108380 / JCM 13579 / CDC 945) TaxID=679197 RepID=E5XQA7_SEGRC|nr:hypothetical protein [Segniliparus rugosus]EFV13469.1 hypothetical protein HMPREF9336_01679 [Segniliparus rugosus ATCC BAA-974]